MEQLQDQSTASCGDLERLAAAAATVGYSSNSLTFAPAVEMSDVAQISVTPSPSTAADFPIDTAYNIARPASVSQIRFFRHYPQKIFVDPNITEDSVTDTGHFVKAKSFSLVDKMADDKGIVYPVIETKMANFSPSDVQLIDGRPADVLVHKMNAKSSEPDIPLRNVVHTSPILQLVQQSLHKESTVLDAQYKQHKNVVHANNALSTDAACSSNSPPLQVAESMKLSTEVLEPRVIDGVKWYICPVCNDRFKIEYQIKRHMIIHSGEKRGALSLETKVEIIKRIQSGEKQVDLANEYNVGRSTLSSLSKNSQKILDVFKDGKFHPESKRMKGAMREDVETVLYEWYQQATEMGVGISGPILCKKAKDFAAKLGNGDFKATHGWLDRFKHRKNIALSRGKTAKDRDTNEDGVDSKMDFTEHILPSLLIDYQANDIFYASEMGLFYDTLPKEAESLKGKRCAGGVSSKHRITVLLCTNMTGGEKFPLLVIGRNPSPRCFKSVKSLPVQYLTNPKAWMTSEHFSSWLADLDLWFVQQNRKVLLVVPSMPIHSKRPKLNSVRIIPSPVSFLGPLKLGIIHSLKKNYRRMILQSYINILETKEGNKNKRKHRKCKYDLDLLVCLHKLSSAWLAVSQSTITHSFQRSGLGKYGFWNISTPVESSLGMENLDLFYKLTTLGVTIPVGFNFQDYVSFDDDLQVCYLMDDDDIIATVRGSTSSSSEFEVSDDAAEMDKDLPAVQCGPQFSEVDSSLNIIKNHLSCHQATEEVYRVIAHLEYLLGKTT